MERFVFFPNESHLMTVLFGWFETTGYVTPGWNEDE